MKNKKEFKKQNLLNKYFLSILVEKLLNLEIDENWVLEIRQCSLKNILLKMINFF